MSDTSAHLLIAWSASSSAFVSTLKINWVRIYQCKSELFWGMPGIHESENVYRLYHQFQSSNKPYSELESNSFCLSVYVVQVASPGWPLLVFWAEWCRSITPFLGVNFEHFGQLPISSKSLTSSNFTSFPRRLISSRRWSRPGNEEALAKRFWNSLSGFITTVTRSCIEATIRLWRGLRTYSEQ